MQCPLDTLSDIIKTHEQLGESFTALENEYGELRSGLEMWSNDVATDESMRDAIAEYAPEYAWNAAQECISEELVRGEMSDTAEEVKERLTEIQVAIGEAQVRLSRLESFAQAVRSALAPRDVERVIATADHLLSPLNARLAEQKRCGACGFHSPYPALRWGSVSRMPGRPSQSKP
jgi:hypothetical protein